MLSPHQSINPFPRCMPIVQVLPLIYNIILHPNPNIQKHNGQLESPNHSKCSEWSLKHQVTVDYPRLTKDQGKLQGVEITQDFEKVLCKPSTSSLFDARSASSLCSFLPSLTTRELSLDNIIIIYNHDTDQHVDPHTDQDANQESAWISIFIVATITVITVPRITATQDHHGSILSMLGISWTPYRPILSSYALNQTPSQKSQDPHRAFPIIPLSFPIYKWSHKNSVSNMALWVCLHSPLHVLAHASAAWSFVLLLLPVKRKQGFKVKVCD